METVERPLGIMPFRFDRDKVGEPSSFEFRFLLGDRVFVYGFDVTSEQIVNEWLTVLKGDDELTIFERSREGLTQIGEKTKQTFADDATMSETLRLLAGLPIKGNQLFLSRILSLPETSQGKTLNAVVRWLTQDLVILGAKHRASDILDRLYDDPTFRSFSSFFLQGVGTGIATVLDLNETTRDISEAERRLLPKLRRAGLPLSEFLGAAVTPCKSSKMTILIIFW